MRLQRRPVHLAEPARDGPRPVDPRGRDQQTQRGRDPRRSRTDQPLQAELAGDVIGVHRTGAAGCQQGELTDVVALLRDVDARGGRHVLVDHIVDAPGDLGNRHAEGRGQRARRRGRRVAVDPHAAAREESRIEIAQQQVRVRHGQRGAAPAVADRSRLGAGAAGADLQQPHAVDMGDAATAGADLDQLDGGYVHRQAAADDEALLARRLETVGDMRLAVLDHRELRRRAAHVERQNILLARRGAEMGGHQGPRRRTRFQQQNRPRFRLFDMGEPAVGEHHEERRTDPEPARLCDQTVEIALRQRFDVGVGRGGRRPFVLTDLGRDLVRGREEQIRMRLRDSLQRRVLVRWIGVAMQKNDGE